MLKKISILLVIIALAISCSSTKTEVAKNENTVNEVKSQRGAEENIPSFHTSFPGLPIGVAISSSSYFDTTNTYNKLLRHFNGFVYENSMKMDAMQPVEGDFRFDNAKKMIDYAKNNNAIVRGHTLLWHSQYPKWFFTDSNGNDVSKEVLLQRIEAHIKTIAGELGDGVNTWDVVNEVLDEDGSLRKSKYLEIIGSDEYISKAFIWAKESSPNSKLFINDYSVCFPGAKQDGLYNLVKKLLEQGVPIDGVGFQAHISISFPNVEDIRKSIRRFAELGLDVEITELDVSIYKSQSEAKKEITEDVLIEQALRYRDLFNMFMEEANNGNLNMVTIWGISDDKTWLNDFPVKGRGNAPLLFDRNLKAKPAYWGIVDPAKLPVSLKEEKEISKVVPVIKAKNGSAVIDGKIESQWSNTDWVDLNIKTEGSTESGSKFKVLWNNDYVNVLINIIDSKLNVDSPNPWEQDSVEIFIDEKNEKSTSFQEDDAQYRVNYNNVQTFNGGNQEKFLSATTLTENGYIVEVGIPISYIKLSSGVIVGFDVQINNADESGVRKGIVNWANDTNMGYTDTSGFGLLKLE